ncbi:TPA: hypothetical protein DIU27_00655 [Candidatus Collierbacteria bacterium]|uniref:Uncharacterized protein n=1 Tax=Candidatus Collierbacteria bacterium GW2011_GWB2_44_22 TaxID=1618387 RepID=A0A0G1HZG6_9BACT|nr:MAG: hypothetical protein UW31_C0004G0064 [Candidatus Collierbacteria bacterium GW2011_GWA2_44_13]KKT48400.1 MAG: hypothetical protein UW42_C0059G0002 [Candidatus Collierbacteria bacterium GW2011_GWB1_44_197]KKT52365.1 MAG: hypothetical protein UW44_C0002G0031 [Candidatus Collierbacteria bacterium GW2011_GWB2_44_22]KKT62818.1 MAG: hypothetical protein UW56_C0003G0004 [Candidatus Collierbacteria bacterium GW2011_GWD1_44_27]KKT64392.1 MAG: hypothetical protein UW58_C0046G0004 [Candidatus Colli
MKNRQIIFTFVFVILAVCLEWWLFRTTTTYGTTVHILVDQGDLVTISGVDTVSISAVDDSYFRIYAGDARLLAEPDSQDRFFVSASEFPVSNWEIMDGQLIEITLNSDNLMVVQVEQSLETKVIGIFLLSLVFLLLWLLVLLLLS